MLANMNPGRYALIASLAFLLAWCGPNLNLNAHAAGKENWQFSEATFVKYEEDIGEWLKDAEECAAQGRYGETVILLQKATERGGTGLTTQDHRSYVNICTAVERIVRALPPAALEAYRAQMDPLAQTAFEAARKSADTAATRTALRRYFMTSMGDDEALFLASRLIDDGSYRFA